MICKVLKSTNTTQLLRYIGKDEPHNIKYTNHRNLLVYTQNLDPDYTGKPNFMYSAMQMKAVRKLSNEKRPPKKKRDSKTAGYHLIISFSEKDFPPAYDKKLQKQARQARDLVVGFLNERFKNTSMLYLGVQRDGESGYLHVHCGINAINTDGKVFDTRQISMFDSLDGKVKGFRNEFNKYLVKHFKEVTGREFTPVVPKKKQFQKSKVYRINQRDGYKWQDDLYNRVDTAFYNATDMKEFEKILDDYGVTLKRRTYHGKPSFTYHFEDKNGQEQNMRAYRISRKTGEIGGLGRKFMPDMVEVQLHKNALERAKNKRKRKRVKKQPAVSFISVKNANEVKKENSVQISKTVKTEPNKQEKFVKKTAPDMSLQEQFYKNTNNYENTKQQENDHPYLP